MLVDGMERITGKLTEILNNCDPVYVTTVDVYEASEPTYKDLETLWAYYKHKQEDEPGFEVNPALEQFFIDYPTLVEMFDSHYESDEEHLIAYYCGIEDQALLIQLKEQFEDGEFMYHHVTVQAPGLVEIMKELVDGNANRVGAIVWVNV
jgi:hypothetical protein